MITANTGIHITTYFWRQIFQEQVITGSSDLNVSVELIKMTKINVFFFSPSNPETVMFSLNYFSLLLSSPRTVDTFQD